MCGIVGFTGHKQAAPILLAGLKKLEYRGYDSAGIAVRDGEELAQVVKATGKLKNLSEKTDGGNTLKGTPSREPAASVTRAGRLTATRRRQTRIPMYRVTARVPDPDRWSPLLWACTTVSSRTTRN